MIEISNYIQNNYKPIQSDQSISKILGFFNEIKFSHFPLMDCEVYIGSVAKVDLETFETQKKISDYRYYFEGFFVRKAMDWLEVLSTFANNNTNILPILDENNHYLGYYELETILKLFIDTPFLKENGETIIVKNTLSGHSLGQITNIVESNNGKLLGVFISDSDFKDVEVTVKIISGNINEIIQSFRRYGYEIVSNHQVDSYVNILKERSDYLEKYLSI